jgi:hypothetical protein
MAYIDCLQHHHFQPDIIQPSVGRRAAIVMDNAAGAIGKRKGLCRIKIMSSFVYSLVFHGTYQF